MGASWRLRKSIYQETQSEKAGNAHHTHKHDNSPMSTKMDIENTLCNNKQNNGRNNKYYDLHCDMDAEVKSKRKRADDIAFEDADQTVFSQEVSEANQTSLADIRSHECWGVKIYVTHIGAVPHWSLSKDRAEQEKK